MKNAFWFRHDSNAKDDPKCVLLIEQLGLEGYGIYWILVETLREQPEYKYPLALVPALARRYNTSSQKVEAVIKGYQLFAIDDDQFFFSQSLLQRMEEYDGKREQARLAGKRSAEVRKNQLLINDRSTTVERPLNNRSTIGEDSIREEYISCQLVADSWNQIVTSLPKITKITDVRKKAIRSRSDDMAEFERVFRKVEASDFLSGRNGQWIGCGFDWVLNPSNWTKVIEGNYDNRQEVRPKNYVN